MVIEVGIKYLKDPTRINCAHSDRGAPGSGGMDGPKIKNGVGLVGLKD